MISWQGWIFNKAVSMVAKRTNKASSFDYQQQRQNIERFSRFFKVSKKMRYQSITIENLPAEWIHPPQPGTKVILYIHGGAFIMGSINTHRSLMAKIAGLTSCSVLALEYRLAPEHPFPAGLDDCLMAYNWMLQQGIAAENIILIGDSSGGNLALATTLLLRDQDIPLPGAIAGLSPWLDLTFSGGSIIANAKTDPLLDMKYAHVVRQHYLQNQTPESPLVSPLFADLSLFPPTYIQASNTEILYSDALRFAEKARGYQVDIHLQIYQNMIHSWQFAHTWLPEAKKALQDLADFILNLQQPSK